MVAEGAPVEGSDVFHDVLQIVEVVSILGAAQFAQNVSVLSLQTD